MAKRLLYPAVLMLVVLMTGPAFGWSFTGCVTVTEAYWGADGLVYMNDGSTLVQAGALVQFVIGLDGAPIVDPLSFFDVNTNGVIDAGAEKAAVQAWVNAGANPAAISGGTNVLLTASNWNGTTTLATPGEVNLFPADPYNITTGIALDKFEWRIWNLTPEEMEDWCTVPGQELWYGTGREYGSYDWGDTGWNVNPDPANWVGFFGYVGWEVYMGTRDQNTLDTYLGTCGEGPVIPEPGMMLLIGSAGLLALLRKKK
jgi:hypothetical protein